MPLISLSFLDVYSCGTCGTIIFAVTTTHPTVSCNLGCQYKPLFSLSFLDVFGFNQKQQQSKLVSGFTMLDTPVPIRTLKLSNIGPGYYLDRRPSREFQVLLVPIPLPPADRVQSFQTLFVSIKWFRPSETKKSKLCQRQCCFNPVTRLCDFSPIGLLLEAHWNFKKRWSSPKNCQHFGLLFAEVN